MSLRSLRLVWITCLAIYFVWKYVSFWPFADFYFTSLDASPLHWSLEHLLCPLMIAFALGLFWKPSRSWCSLGLWLGHVATYLWVPLARSPETGPLGAVLLTNALLPDEDEESDAKRWLALMLILGQFYFVAGIMKLQDPNWRNGTGLLRLEGFPGLRLPALIELLHHSPWIVVAVISYAVVFAYLTFFACALYTPGFLVINSVLLFEHASLIFLAKLDQVSFAMVLVHTWLWLNFLTSQKVRSDWFARFTSRRSLL